MHSRVVEGKEREGAKFSDYFDFNQPLKGLPSHRALALFRGRNEGVLRLELAAGPEEHADDVCQTLIARRFGVSDQGRAADGWLKDSAHRAFATSDEYIRTEALDLITL